MCYSLYLTHYPIFFGLVPRLPFGAASGLVALLAALVGGALFYLAIERPFMTSRKFLKVS